MTLHQDMRQMRTALCGLMLAAKYLTAEVSK